MTSQERSASYLASFQVSASGELSASACRRIRGEGVKLTFPFPSLSLAALSARLDSKQEEWSPVDISLEIAKLKRGLVEASDFLPRYDQRKLESVSLTLSFPPPGPTVHDKG